MMAAVTEAGPEALVRPSAPRRLAKRLVKLGALVVQPVSTMLYRRRPAAALAFGASVGRALSRFYQPVPAVLLARLLGEPLASRHRVLARQIACHNCRKTLLREAVRAHGVEPLARALRWTGRDRLVELHQAARPAIIAVTHLGPAGAIRAAFHDAGVPLAFLGSGRENRGEPDGWRVLGFGRSPAARALWLKAGLDHLRNGGLLGLAVDGQHGPPGDGPGLFGTDFRLRKGIAILHRLSGAPVVPVTTLWDETGRGIEVIVEEPLPAPDPALPGPEIEKTMQRTLCSWLEAHVRAHAGELPSQLVLRQCFGLKGRHAAPQPDD